jgi:3-deoxy-D-manno-octulosonate 8-phosphate phosphatase (KDO 8-P phosphatase)
MHQTELEERIRNIELLLLDVDGVLTDGRITFVPDGDKLVELKFFHVQDGAGIALAHRVGLRTGIISGRSSPIVEQRARELSIGLVYLGKMNKLAVLDEIIEKTAIPAERMCFVGDEVVDLPVMHRVGFSVAVANACRDVTSRAAYVTRAAGGEGAVREVIELILRTQGKWDEAIEEFLR